MYFMEDIQYKKFYRKADKHLNGKIKVVHSKRNNHKMKPYFVLQYLLKNADENHAKSAYDIIEPNDISKSHRMNFKNLTEWYCKIIRNML